MSTASIKEVARHAGVSIGTVSNVLNHPDVVARPQAARAGAIAVLRYVRNDWPPVARRPQPDHRDRELDVNPFFTDVVRGAEEAAEEHGAMVMVCNSGESAARERRHLDLLEEQRVQGVLITPVDDSRDSRLGQLVRRGTPVVYVDRESGQRGRCSVAVDDVLGGRLAAEHLVEEGHERVAFVGGPFGIRQVADRYAGFSAALADRAEPVAQPLVVTTRSLSVAAGRRAGEEIAGLPADTRPTAVFCANDLMALGVLQEMTQRGIAVPGDLAIIGYDDIEFAGAAAVPLSSVSQPREQLGRTAAQLLLEEINDGAAHQHRHVVFTPQLVIRRSTTR
jgi:LacI family transcriptional regulator